MLMETYRSLGSAQSTPSTRGHLLGDLYKDLDRRLDEDLCPRGNVLLCGELGVTSRTIENWASDHGAQLTVMGDDILTIAWFQTVAKQIDFLIVDGDYLADTEDTVDFCMQVRRALPELRIILISSEVRGHDLTCERMMACDATLKLPISRRCLAGGAEAAIVNHDIFISSRRSWA